MAKSKSERARKPRFRRFTWGQVVMLLPLSERGLSQMGIIDVTDPHYSVRLFEYVGRMRRIPTKWLRPLTKAERGEGGRRGK